MWRPFLFAICIFAVKVGRDLPKDLCDTTDNDAVTQADVDQVCNRVESMVSKCGDKTDALKDLCNFVQAQTKLKCVEATYKQKKAEVMERRKFDCLKTRKSCDDMDCFNSLSKELDDQMNSVLSDVTKNYEWERQTAKGEAAKLESKVTFEYQNADLDGAMEQLSRELDKAPGLLKDEKKKAEKVMAQKDKKNGKEAKLTETKPKDIGKELRAAMAEAKQDEVDEAAGFVADAEMRTEEDGEVSATKAVSIAESAEAMAANKEVQSIETNTLMRDLTQMERTKSTVDLKDDCPLEKQMAVLAEQNENDDPKSNLFVKVGSHWCYQDDLMKTTGIDMSDSVNGMHGKQLELDNNWHGQAQIGYKGKATDMLVEQLKETNYMVAHGFTVTHNAESGSNIIWNTMKAEFGDTYNKWGEHVVNHENTYGKPYKAHQEVNFAGPQPGPSHIDGANGLTDSAHR